MLSNDLGWRRGCIGASPADNRDASRRSQMVFGPLDVLRLSWHRSTFKPYLDIIYPIEKFKPQHDPIAAIEFMLE